MVTLTAGTGPVINVNSFESVWEAGPVSFTSTVMEIGPSSAGRYRLTGTNFADTVGGSRPDTGTVTTFGIWFGSNMIYTLSGLNIPFADFEAAYANGSHLFALMLGGDDVMQGSPLDDTIAGYNGHDEIHGHAGDDILEGSDGHDRLFGDAGDDDLFGRGGEDELIGGDGDDYLDTSASKAFIVDGGAGVDTWYGNLTWSTLALDIDAAAIASDSGLTIDADHIVRRVEKITLWLGPGDDTFRDHSLGGDDYIVFLTGSDTAYVSSGRDTLFGNDRWKKGPETDVDRLFIDYSTAAAGLRSDLIEGAPAGPVFLLWEGPTGFDDAARSVAADSFERTEIKATDFADSLVGTGGSDLILGRGGNDFLTPQLGDDVLDGGEGSDTMSGFFTAFLGDTFGPGVHTPSLRSALRIDLAKATAQRLPDYSVSESGTWAVRSLGTVTLRSIENISGSEDGDYLSGDALVNRLSGQGGSDELDGRNGNDVLKGGEGRDTLTGGPGNDFLDGGPDDDTVSYLFARAAVAVNLGSAAAQDTGGAGIDTLRAIEHVSGSVYADTLIGSGVANQLRGGKGADTMIGGNGNDSYYVDNARDKVVETSASGGTDTVLTSMGYTLGSHVENLVFIGFADINGTGNALSNHLEGTSGANVLDGRAGADRMEGRFGDDIYVVDNRGDKAVENSGWGIDTVRSSITFTLGAHLEQLALTGSRDINGTGNTLANKIVGNVAANRLDGGAGADTMIGGNGNDVYVVDNAGDKALETSARGGIDSVLSAISYTLGAYMDNLTLTGTGNSNGTGNALANALKGNAGANMLDGGAGADTMTGGDGDDVYAVDNVGDKVVETSASGGTDTVQSSVSLTLGARVENLKLTGTSNLGGTGNALGNIITGNASGNRLDGGDGADSVYGGGGVDTMFGGNGDDRLFGGAGSDRLGGGAGMDHFYFDAALGSTNVDRISDFSAAEDTLLLDRDVFTGISADGVLADSDFRAGAAALDASDRILYDAATGHIRYDPDGSGSAGSILFLQVTAGTALTNADFVGYI